MRKTIEHRLDVSAARVLYLRGNSAGPDSNAIQFIPEIMKTPAMNVLSNYDTNLGMGTETLGR